MEYPADPHSFFVEIAHSLVYRVVQFPNADEGAPESEGATPRALPLLAGVAARLAPTLLKVAPKLSSLTKLTKVLSSAMANSLHCRAPFSRTVSVGGA